MMSTTGDVDGCESEPNEKALLLLLLLRKFTGTDAR